MWSRVSDRRILSRMSLQRVHPMRSTTKEAHANSSPGVANERHVCPPYVVIPDWQTKVGFWRKDEQQRIGVFHDNSRDAHSVEVRSRIGLPLPLDHVHDIRKQILSELISAIHYRAVIYIYIYIYAVGSITWPHFGQSRVNNLATVGSITWPPFLSL